MDRPPPGPPDGRLEVRRSHRTPASRRASAAFLGDCRELDTVNGSGHLPRPIRTHTTESHSRAQKGGQHMGRPPKLTEAPKAEARRRRAEGATLAELARSYDVGKSTISRRTE